MRKIILLASLVAGGVAFSATAYANNWLLYLPAILAGSGGTTTTPTTDTSNKWLLFLPAILSGAQNNTTVVTEAPFNDTGIVLNSSQVACGTGDKEDCNYGRDADSATNSDSDGHAGFNFTKLDSNGNDGTNSDGTWDCVRDEVTGLVWADQGTWSTSDKKDWSEAQTYATSYANCGISASGWRLPTPKELVSIVSYHLLTSSVDEDYFRLPVQPTFWTDSEVSGDSSKAWYVGFDKGYTEKSLTTSSFYVRLVSGTTLPAQFTVNTTDGTVTDSSTGLIWKQCLEGYSGSDCATVAPKTTYTWAEALQLDDGVWRLPNIKELQSIIEYQNTLPAINTTVFPGVPTDAEVWSNSPLAEAAGTPTDIAWYVDFADGRLRTLSGNTTTEVKYVRLVKDVPVSQ